MTLKQFFGFSISGFLFVSLCTGQNTQNEKKTNKQPEKAWMVLGPGGGGGVFLPVVSPFDENFVITHCDMTEAYVSHDGGLTWDNKNLWNVPDDIEFDPADRNTVYIATKGFLYSEDRGSGVSLLLRSEDQGVTWRIIYPDVSKAKPLERLQSTNLTTSQIIPGAPDGTIQKVVVDPADNRMIFLGFAPLVDYMSRSFSGRDTSLARLLVSKDRGATWKVVTRLPGKNVLGIVPDDDHDQVLVFTDQGCAKININTGVQVKINVPVKRINAVKYGGAKSGTLIYLMSNFRLANEGVNGGLYLSDDMGATWNQINTGLLDGIAKGRVPEIRQGLAVCAAHPEVAYLSSVNPEPNAAGKTDDIYCIFKTNDAGKSWHPVLQSSSPGGYLTHNYRGSWMDEIFDPGWGGNPIDLGVAPGNPDVCYAGDNGRGYKTTDGGKTWVQIYSHNNADGSYTNTGLNVTTCYGVHFDPFNKDHFFICYTDIGLFHTFNGGKSWYPSLAGIPRDWQNTCYQVAFDPAVQGRVWSAWANAHDLPRTKMFGGYGFGNYSGGIAVSNDAGKSWQKSNTGIPEHSICTNIMVDPSSPEQSRTLYASIFDKGIYKSADGGKTWKSANNGLGDNLFAWQLRQDARGRIFALFARGERKGKTVDGAIYFSDDKAAGWEKMTLPDSVNGPHDLLIDPENPDILYVSCWPRSINNRDKFGGVIKSTDGGHTWKIVFDPRVRVNSAGLDPHNPEKVYINTFQNAAYRTDNGGKTWERIEGYRFKWGQRAIPDINHPGMLFLTTYGGSVFYGPADGVEGATDDIANMPQGWW